MAKTSKYFDRELSWLAFNHRVLQEAADQSVPLFERIKFLAIFSSNLDEFFRVRVAILRSLIKGKDKINLESQKLLNKIQKVVNTHQEEYGTIIKEVFIKLKKNNIYLLDSQNLSSSNLEFISEYFNHQVISHIKPMLLAGIYMKVFLKNKGIYLACRLVKKNGIKAKKTISRISIIEIPTDKLPRFIILPEVKEKKLVIFIEDVIRNNLEKIFPGYNVEESYSIKLTRDADLYIDDEYHGNLLEKIKKALSKRNTGLPSRFLYDSKMPKSLLRILKKAFDLKKEDLISGGRYHNLNDLFEFPSFGINSLSFPQHIPHRAAGFLPGESVFNIISRQDRLINFPYQSYEHVINFLDESANDPSVKSIKITLYRTSSDSKIIKALINAAKNKKAVTVFVEVKARFDEESNFKNADELEKAGVKVLYSFPGLKVHCKICLINKTENERNKYYAYLSTGNFNENTSKIYSDFGFFTADDRITEDVVKVFSLLEQKIKMPEFEHLLVAPFYLRNEFINKIDNEIKNALKGKEAKITLKLNSLEDKKIIKKLYNASQAGVKIKIIVRGICCLIPGVVGLSENIIVISIIDRYLEHSRVYIFHNNGSEDIYLASADWMTRNFKRRIEIAFPIYSDHTRKILKELIAIQLNDNVKARKINIKQSNPFVKSNSVKKIRSQYEIYEYLSN
ncbi:MAG: polyphosphate kinase 1 [Ignavibacteriales bacterium CG_4_9_14_3_um_filter_30_11]|nr:MAG: polyphosphate kinase 1 [Ignavibacteriales bacterium CG_4_9_14_3_um_filter_30_11]